MIAIMSLLAAVTAPPSCTAPVGEPVAITSTVMLVQAVGGYSRSGNGSSPPGQALVGLLHYEWGLLLRSVDPRFTDLDLSPESVHSRSSGCWFQWENRWGKNGVETIAEPHIGPSGYNDGYTPEQPANTPTIAGYRFVMADKAYGPDHAWIGLWNAANGTGRSYVIAFTDQRHSTLASFPFRLGALATLPSPDTPALGMTIVGEGRNGEPVPYFELLAPTGVSFALPFTNLPALAAKIEQTMTMPNGAYPISAYGRNYALTGMGTVIGRYQLAHPRQLVSGCSKVSINSMRDCTKTETAALQKNYDINFAQQTPAGSSRWFDSPADVPTIFDGACTQVNVEYDLLTHKVVSVSCNGVA